MVDIELTARAFSPDAWQRAHTGHPPIAEASVAASPAALVLVARLRPGRVSQEISVGCDDVAAG